MQLCGCSVEVTVAWWGPRGCVEVVWGQIEGLEGCMGGPWELWGVSGCELKQHGGGIGVVLKLHGGGKLW